MRPFSIDAVRGLHPAIGGKNPGRRNRAERHHAGSEEVKLGTDAIQPKSIMPKKPASKKKEVRTSSPIIGPIAGPAICPNLAKPRPNSNDRTIPVTTPTPKPWQRCRSRNGRSEDRRVFGLQPKSLDDHRNAASPMEIVGKIMWKVTVKANWTRARTSGSSFMIVFYPAQA